MLGSSPQGDPKSFYFLRGKRSGTIQSDFLGVSRYNVENAEREWGGWEGGLQWPRQENRL